MKIKDEEILNAIISYIKEHGYSPTFQEIATMVSIKSKGTICYRLQKMLSEGLIETDNSDSPRAIRVPGYGFTKSERINLEEIKTCELVEELKKREGVKTEYAEPHQDKGITVNGPASILIVID